MSELARHLRRTTEQMACFAKVDMSLWNEHSNACLDSANAVERLEAERDALRAELAAERESLHHERLSTAKAEVELDALRAENEKLREALKPFARAVDYYASAATDEYPTDHGEFTLGDLRRARAAFVKNGEVK